MTPNPQPTQSVMEYSVMSAYEHPSKPLFNQLAKISEAQKPLPTWEQYGAASSEGRRTIARIWQAKRGTSIDAMLLLMKFETMNGPLDDANPDAEFDYDGDGGRGYDDYLRDNGMGGHTGFRSLRDIAAPVIASLPEIASPSITPDDTEQPAKSRPPKVVEG